VDVKAVTADIDQSARRRMSACLTRFQKELRDRADGEENEDDPGKSEGKPYGEPKRTADRNRHRDTPPYLYTIAKGGSIAEAKPFQWT
jgi:hypothetical protein